MRGGLEYSAYMPATSVDGSVLSWTAYADERRTISSGQADSGPGTRSATVSHAPTETAQSERDAGSLAQARRDQHSVSPVDPPQSTTIDPALPARKKHKHSPSGTAAVSGTQETGLSGGQADEHTADKCDRKWPKCGRCTLKGLDCHLSQLVPVAFVHSQPHPAEVRVAELEARVASLEQDIATQNLFLPHAAQFVESIDLAAKGGDADAAFEWMKHRETADAASTSSKAVQTAAQTRVELAGQLSAETRSRNPSLQRSFSLHLLEAFFAACCSSLPVFRPWHTRLPTLFNLRDLDAPDRVAVAVFCAIGARSTPHSALLGIANAASETTSPSTLAMSGIRREQACRALNAEAIDLFEKLSIADDTSEKTLNATMALMQSCVFNELVPRRSRSMVRTAFGQLKDLLDLTATDSERNQLVMMYGLPLLHADSVTSAYGRKTPLITQQDLDSHFGVIRLPDLSSGTLSFSVSNILGSDLDDELDHERLTKASMVILRWIVQTLREFARISSPRASHSALPMDVIVSLWSALDQIHASVQNLQHFLVNLDKLPPGCENDGCQDLHLRFITRMSREVDNVTSLVHSLLDERRSGSHGMPEQVDQEWYEESEKRVRKSLKLAAFYFEAYSISSDPHQTYYLAWQLELMPTWTLLAVQRHGELDGPLTADLELTETELDWIEKGLKVAMSYHPVAERRLAQIKAARRLPRPDSLPSRANQDRPGMRLPFALKQTLVNAVPNWG
ncbi:hypothetical protein OIV83_001919 [Microbotryomycetes sp. JL201]|nr:hypothetical protein OIV83_001919 [Microbotryomycetes sp. JL201]